VPARSSHRHPARTPRFTNDVVAIFTPGG
jgi:hypothetical protein